MAKRIEWNLETWSVDKLRPYDKNPRVITEQGLKHLKESFDDIGNAQPININIDGTILSGHARFKQLTSEGAKDIPVYVPDRELTPKQEETVIVRMNKNIAGEWDFDILANEFEIEDLIEFGFEEKDFPIVLEPEDLSDKNKEIDTENFGNDLEHTCPKCGFEFNE